MIEQTSIRQRAVNAFPFLAGDNDLSREFFRSATHFTLDSAVSIREEGDECINLALLLSGTVRAFKISESGRELTLYRLERGDSCTLTASCILSRTRFPAFAVTETAVEGLMVPAATVRDWMDRYGTWRHFIFGLISQRLSSIITLVDQVAFGRLDRRIAQLLIERMGDDHSITITHQQIAQELGSVREVVSRLLKDLHSDGIIRITRGIIEIHDPPRLVAMSGG